jgi:ABC-2 type transport system ATP-binding protein
MPEAQILVENLGKTYRVPERAAGLAAALRSFVRRQVRDVEAVTGVSFTLQPGEIVGFIGPNGAGKTTVLKMLGGLLRPTAGRALVSGFRPDERRHEFLRQISMVLGNRSQMLWDIPPLDSFRVLGDIYGMAPAAYRTSLDELVEMLELQDLLARPVRTFSLGERMKCELVAGLLHRPQVLFLDEPTLGLDVSMQARLRRFIAEYNRRSGATIILTSHYMADVVTLCPRVILIHQGRLLYDGALAGLARRLAPFKLLRVTLDGPDGCDADWPLPAGTTLVEREHNNLTLRVRRELAAAVTGQVLQALPVADLTVEDPPIEAVIDQVYRGGEL